MENKHRAKENKNMSNKKLLIIAILGLIGGLVVLSFLLLFPKSRSKNIFPPLQKSWLESTENCLAESFKAEKSKKENTFTIMFKDEILQPVENKNEALNCFRFLPKGEKYYAIVQLYYTLQPEEKRILDSNGINLLQYLPNNSWFVNFSHPLSEKEIQQVKRIIRWVGKIESKYKLTQEIWEGKFGSWAIDRDYVSLSIYFFEDVPSEEAEGVIKNYGGEILQKPSLPNFAYEVKIKKDKVKEIASENTVRYIDQTPPPPVPLAE